jgi:hypothetical protein
MVILFYIGCGILGLLMGFLIAKIKMKDTCQHKYKLIKDGDIVNYDQRGNPIVKGFMKVYECEHCKKMNSQKLYV